MNTIYVITGQTATGKTAYAIDLAQKINGEIMNADARQVYKDLDIVTGKDLQLTDGEFHFEKRINTFDIGYYLIDKNVNTMIKIWLYDIVEPSENFSAYDYKQCVSNTLVNIIKKCKTPIIVGGSYLYIKNVLYNTVNTYIPPNQKLRQELSQVSIPKLHLILNSYNADIINKMNKSDRQNPHRLIRKIEIQKGITTHNVSNHPITILDQYHIKIVGFRFKKLDDLKEAITYRVHKRIKNGAVEETKELLKCGYSINSPGMNAIGYSQIISFLDNKISKQKMIDEWIVREIQYAKRQYTFMKQNNEIIWTDTVNF